MLTVTFDKLLANGTSAIGNWLYLLGNGPPAPYLQAAVGVTSGLTVTLQMVGGGLPIPPLDTCNYLAVPPDVIGRNGLPVASFIGLPVVKIP